MLKMPSIEILTNNGAAHHTRSDNEVSGLRYENREKSEIIIFTYCTEKNTT